MKHSRIISTGRALLAANALVLCGIHVGNVIWAVETSYIGSALGVITMLIVATSVWLGAPRSKE